MKFTLGKTVSLIRENFFQVQISSTIVLFNSMEFSSSANVTKNQVKCFSCEKIMYLTMKKKQKKNSEDY